MNLDILRTLHKIKYSWEVYLLAIIISVFLFFLPYSYAFTLQIGFPLKISEISLVFFFLYLCWSLLSKSSSLERLKGKSLKTFTILMLTFFSIALLSFIINSNWNYPYISISTQHRFTPFIDSLLKSAYILVILLASLISYLAFSSGSRKIYLKALNIGAICSALYAWYLFVFSLNNWDLYLLPGMDDWPQHGLFSFGHFIRCGTFKEGNYAGLFFLTISIINFFYKKYIYAGLVLLGAIPTFSSMVLVGIIVFFFTLVIFRMLKSKKYYYFFLLLIPAFLYFSLSKNRDFNFLVSKLGFAQNSNFQDAQNSKNERINLAKAAFKIGLDNPVLGVGLSNFSNHFQHYNTSKTINQRPNFKYIPNNIYLEIFSELGLLGIIIFIIIQLFSIYQSLRDRSGILFSGTLMLMVYFLAFPTFSILFVWVFYGLLLTLKK